MSQDTRHRAKGSPAAGDPPKAHNAFREHTCDRSKDMIQREPRSKVSS